MFEENFESKLHKIRFPNILNTANLTNKIAEKKITKRKLKKAYSTKQISQSKLHTRNFTKQLQKTSYINIVTWEYGLKPLFYH